MAIVFRWLKVWTFSLGISALAIFSLPVNQAFCGTVYDAVHDFSIKANPNGVWSYGWSATLGSQFNLDTYSVLAGLCWTDLIGWGRSPIGGIGCPDAPIIVHNDTRHTVYVGRIIVFANTLSVHPSEAGDYSVLQWTAPSTGKFRVHALFEGTDPRPTTTDVHVFVQAVGTKVMTALLDGQIDSYRHPLSGNFQVTLNTGDTVSFAVGFGADGNWGFDSTAVQAHIVRK